MRVELGYRYKDKVSGFEGVAVVRSEHLTGCARVTLEGGDSKEPKAYVFDEFMLEQVGEERVVEPLVGQTIGGVDRWEPAPRY